MDLRPRNGFEFSGTLPEEETIEYWWDPGSSSPGSIEEEQEYDIGYLDLGAETPSTSESTMQSYAGTPHLPARRRSFRRTSSPAANKPNRLSKYDVDRDCGICFEYAVRPCRTLCCGNVFCTEHLADWLHGPEAEGRCPNCENACSLAGGTLSLVPPKRNNSTHVVRSSPPLTLVPPHPSAQDRVHPQVASTKSSSTASSPSTCSCASTVDYSDTTVSPEESKVIEEQCRIHHPFSNSEEDRNLTISLSLPWGVASRLVSIMIFLMFLYKLRS